MSPVEFKKTLGRPVDFKRSRVPFNTYCKTDDKHCYEVAKINSCNIHLPLDAEI